LGHYPTNDKLHFKIRVPNNSALPIWIITLSKQWFYDSRKTHQRISFLPVSKAHTHKFHIFQKWTYMYIGYLCKLFVLLHVLIHTLTISKSTKTTAKFYWKDHKQEPFQSLSRVSSVMLALYCYRFLLFVLQESGLNFRYCIYVKHFQNKFLWRLSIMYFVKS
jgi:hypothetical protein